jgi:hypothetical protein
MKPAIFSGSKKSMEMTNEEMFNVQSTLPSKNKIVPDLSENDCTLDDNIIFLHNIFSTKDQDV